MKKTSYIYLLLAGLFVMAGCASQNKTVLLTGYWPPTNEMLRPFSADAEMNPDGWQGKNWQGSGYDVYAYFPEFPGGTKVNPKGDGDFEVDYQDTLADFQRLTHQLKPEVIISFGRGPGPWQIEVNAPWQQEWVNDYSDPTQPEPINRNKALKTTLPAERIQQAVTAAVPDLKVWIDHEGDPGRFLCAYLAYTGMQYQLENDHCLASGFIHVGKEVDVPTARKACEATLQAVLEK